MVRGDIMACEIGLGCKMEMLKVGLEGTRIVLFIMFYAFLMYHCTVWEIPSVGL